MNWLNLAFLLEMKKLYLLLLILVATNCITYAQQFEVVNDFGVDCIMHQIQDKETFYSIAEKYFVRPSTLAICNNLDEDVSIEGKTRLYIPLTETNYYKIRQTDQGNTVFRELTHRVRKGQNLKQIMQEYFVSKDQLLHWNDQNTVDNIDDGQKLIVGFLKYDLNNELAAPLYIVEEKYDYGNEREKAEVEVDYGVTKLKKVKKKRLKNIYNGIKKPKPTIEEPVVAVNQISEKERNFLKKNKIEKKKNKKKIFTSSYAKQKAEREAAIQKRIDIRRKAIAKEQRKKNAIAQKELTREQKIKERLSKAKAKQEQETEKLEAVNVEKKEEAVVVKKEKADPFISTKLQRLTLLKNTTGKASFFYSGTAGAKFYVLTNLAKKGGIIKIKNTQNGRFILAEVIGVLPSSDRAKGVTIKISDNAKLPLGTKSKYFTAKVYY